MLEFLIYEEFGFKKEEVDAISNHFCFTLNEDDWESIEIIDEVDLVDGENIENSENLLMLPTGRVAYFLAELLHKELINQIY